MIINREVQDILDRDEQEMVELAEFDFNGLFEDKCMLQDYILEINEIEDNAESYDSYRQREVDQATSEIQAVIDLIDELE